MSQQQKNTTQPPKRAVNWPLVSCYYAGLPLELLLHNVLSFGVRSVGPRAGGAVLVMFLFVAFHPDENCLPLICYLIAVIALSIVAQISAMIRHWRGDKIHTRYSGRPHLLRLLPRWSEVTIKRIEPFLVLVIGWGVHHFNHPLGSFLMAAAIGLGVVVGIEHMKNRTRALDMNDAMAEQNITMESLRKPQRR